MYIEILHTYPRHNLSITKVYSKHIIVDLLSIISSEITAFWPPLIHAITPPQKSFFYPIHTLTYPKGRPFLARATVGTSLYVSVRQLVSQLVSSYVSVFQNSYQGSSRLCRELRFCLEVICTSQHTSNHQRSLAEQCHTQNFYFGCFKSDFDVLKSKFDLLIEQIEKTTSK